MKKLHVLALITLFASCAPQGSHPDFDKNVHDYAIDATIKIFKILEDALKVYPNQWEGWLYIHKFLEIESNF